MLEERGYDWVKEGTAAVTPDPHGTTHDHEQRQNTSGCNRDFEQFERTLNGESAIPVHGSDGGRSPVSGLSGFPTHADEEWRFTNVAPIAQTAFTRASGRGQAPGRTFSAFVISGAWSDSSRVR